MTYIRDTKKTVEQAVADVEAAVKRYEFGVLHTYDLKAVLESKGFQLASECHVLEICNPTIANEVLKADITVNLALPCRISVYDDAGQTKIGMIPPTDLLKLISNSEELQKNAVEVEKMMVAMIDEAI